MKLAFAVGMCLLLTTIPLLADQGTSALPDLMTYSRSFSEAARFVEPGGNVVKAVVDYTKSEFTVPASMAFSINGVDSDRFRSYVLPNAPDIRAVEIVTVSKAAETSVEQRIIEDFAQARLSEFSFGTARGNADYEREIVRSSANSYLRVSTDGYEDRQVPTVGFPIEGRLSEGSTELILGVEFEPEASWSGANIYFEFYIDDGSYPEGQKTVGVEKELQPGWNEITVPFEQLAVHPDDRISGLDPYLSNEDVTRISGMMVFLRSPWAGEFKIGNLSANVIKDEDTSVATTTLHPAIPTLRIDDFSDGDRLCDRMETKWKFSGTHPSGYWEPAFDVHGYYLPIGGGAVSGQQSVVIALPGISLEDYIGLYLSVSNAALNDMRREVTLLINGSITKELVVDRGDPQQIGILFSELDSELSTLESISIRVVSSDGRAWIQMYDIGLLSSPEQAYEIAGALDPVVTFDSNNLEKEVTLFLVSRDTEVYEWNTQAVFPIYDDSEMLLDTSAVLRQADLALSDEAEIAWSVSSPINDAIQDEVHIEASNAPRSTIRFDNPGIYSIELELVLRTGQILRSDYKTLVYYAEGTPFEVRGIALGGGGYVSRSFMEIVADSFEDLLLMNPNLLRIEQSKAYSLSDWIAEDFSFRDGEHTAPYSAMGEIADLAHSKDLAVMYAMQIACYDCHEQTVEIEGVTEVGSRAEISVSEGFFKPYEGDGYFSIILEMADSAQRSGAEHVNISVELNMLEWPGGRSYWTSLLEETADVFTGEITTQTHNGEFIWWRSDWSYPWDDDYGIPYGSQHMSYISTSEYSRLPITSETSSNEACDMILEGYFDDTPDFIGIGEAIKLMTETFSKPFLNAEYSSTTMASHGYGITTSNTSNELCISLVGHLKAMEHLIRAGVQFAGDVFWLWAGTLMNADYYSLHEFFKLRNARNYSKNMEIIRAYWEDQSLAEYLSTWSGN